MLPPIPSSLSVHAPMSGAPYVKGLDDTLAIDSAPATSAGCAGVRPEAALLDADDRVRALEARVAELSARLAQHVEELTETQHASRTGSWYWNVRTGHSRWSAQTYQLLGIADLTVQPSYARFLERVHPEDRAALHDLTMKAASQRIDVSQEYRVVQEDGTLRHLRTLGHPKSDANGELVYFGAVVDITDTRVAEEKLRAIQDDFARMSRLTTMGELAASVVHEVSQPLAAIATHAASGERWLDREQPSIGEAKAAFSRILLDGTRAARVLTGLRALMAKTSPVFGELDIAGVVDDAIAILGPELRRSNVRLHTQVECGLNVLGDPVQIQQVLLNLSLNAIDAMKGVRDRAHKLSLSADRREDGWVRVQVTDTGGGIDAEASANMFKSFFTTKPNGLGMGLAICKSIVDAHLGQFGVHASSEQGTTFEVVFPPA